MLNFFSTARDDFYGKADGPRRDLSSSFSNQSSMQNPLFLKQAIIVLREELEYFAIPPKASDGASGASAVEVEKEAKAAAPATSEEGRPNEALLQLKKDCGSSLLGRTSIFTALQRNVNRENNVAEQHLIDMLCMR